MNIYGGNDCLRISYIISLFGFFSIHHLFHDSVFDIKVLEQFFVIAGVICIRHNIDVEFDFCFSRRENISVDPDTVSNQTDVFMLLYVARNCLVPCSGIMTCELLSMMIHPQEGCMSVISRGVLPVFVIVNMISSLLPLFDGVIMPVGVFYLYAGRTHFFSAR